MQDSPTPAACRASAQLGRTVDRALEDGPLTPSAYRLLAYLANDRSAATALAEKLAVSRPTVTATTQWLEARGYVVRTADPADGRRNWIALTDAGAVALAESDELVGSCLADVVSGMDDEVAGAVLTALHHLLGALDDYRGGTPKGSEVAGLTAE